MSALKEGSNRELASLAAVILRSHAREENAWM